MVGRRRELPQVTDVMQRHSLIPCEIGWKTINWLPLRQLHIAVYRRLTLFSGARRFAFGQRLPGSAWQRRNVVHYPDLSLAQNFPRLSVAASDIYHTGVSFPLSDGKRVLGVIEMFNAEPRDLPPLPRSSCLPWEAKSEFFSNASMPAERCRRLMPGGSGFFGDIHHRRPEQHSVRQPGC